MTSESQEPLRRRQYRNPPVIEAIARLEWEEQWTWNVTTAGLLFERLRGSYPEEPRAQSMLQANLSPGGSGTDGAAVEVSGGTSKLLFSQQQPGRLLGVSPADISAHGLPPYEGWESLEARLFDGLGYLDGLVPAPRFKTLGLRYVNRIEIPETSIQFFDYLTIAVGLPPGFPQQIYGFFDRTEARYSDDRTTIALTWGSTDGPSGSASILLDLDLYHRPEAPLNLDESRQVLQDLKLKEGEAFEALLQDRLREMFDEILS